MRRDLRHSAGPSRRRPSLRHWLPTLLVLALLAAGLGAYRFEWGQRYLPWLAADPLTEPEQVLPPAGLDLPDWAPPGVGAVALDPGGAILPGKVAAAVADELADPDLGRHVVGAVAPLAPGSPEWTTGDGRYLPASTTKLLTLGAALEALGPDHTFTTRVVRGAGPRDVVLVGGGDPLLASTSLTLAEAESTYPTRADVTTLALQVADALGGRGRVRVRFDDSLFTGPTDNPAWRRDYVPDDIVSPITALMVDSGRETDGDGRHDDPSLAAARAFADGLRAAGLRVGGEPRRVVAPPGAEELAAVESAPLSQVAERILDVSDNEGSEVVAHHVGLATTGVGSFEAGAAGVVETLRGVGIDVTGAQVHDGSGLSRRNRVSTATLIDLIQHAAGPGGEAMRSLVTGMPVAGFTGSLTYRFAEGPEAGLGVVRAKTGTLTGVHALAGIAVDRDGQPLAFVFGADRSPPEERYDAQEALDRAAAALAACRCSTPAG
ncbi:D-alanyl-D-alanine carboxypeptidase/D-alanyl-D-alanine-endopeptidase [Nocardioides sp. zg-1228]|uniref:D-alanyl-D-alanine carboxypeptidase/D-alanyl-D-alanine endopeptidase n=1 Tax=Nocardioides sp. zg-1228 TaxID=2763008 RepID=UPI0016425E87|nr:D-alanyl-D-alanine carboxypeptidase/D-alanyl-D-alanine-endopeptidase [Nocardioides sp. zg-1228]MBC2932592.1 D-alanyl-D-alanine carboxypeptidase/D-alanyl-D-alanine-endopeptidase [Nocardioides sp. zg-1228]QSF58086.1 D-alanyl-D-alanine carboxypeptidase/D-alanyl-D-alanine-endopeptidase [Nocardioides sp. zg-1228]